RGPRVRLQQMSELANSFNVYRYEDRARLQETERRPDQRFDRLGFALHALDLLRPERTRIAVFTSHRLQVTQGIDLGRGPGARWVMVGIPRDASAESIVLALTKIEGLNDKPYALSITLEAAQLTERAN